MYSQFQTAASTTKLFASLNFINVFLQVKKREIRSDMRDRIQIKLDAQIPNIFEEKKKKDIKSAIRAHTKYGGMLSYTDLNSCLNTCFMGETQNKILHCSFNEIL